LSYGRRGRYGAAGGCRREKSRTAYSVWPFSSIFMRFGKRFRAFWSRRVSALVGNNPRFGSRQIIPRRVNVTRRTAQNRAASAKSAGFADIIASYLRADRPAMRIQSRLASLPEGLRVRPECPLRRRFIQN